MIPLITTPANPADLVAQVNQLINSINVASPGGLPFLVASGVIPASGTDFLIPLPPSVLGIVVSTWAHVYDNLTNEVKIIVQNDTGIDVGNSRNLIQVGPAVNFFKDPNGSFQVPNGATVSGLHIFVNQVGGGTSFSTQAPYTILGVKAVGT